MLDDAGGEMKARLRADLRAAMKDRNQLVARVIRTLVAAIDNAEAPSVPQGRETVVQHEFASGSAEVQRLLLTRHQVRGVLASELQERERAAIGFHRMGKQYHAETLREEARVIQHYLSPEVEPTGA